MKNLKQIAKQLGMYLLIIALIVTALPLAYIKAMASGTSDTFLLTQMHEATKIRAGSSEDEWLIYFNFTGTFGEEGEKFSWPATLGGQETTVDVYKDGGMFLVWIYEHQIACDGSANTTLVLKSGETVEGSKGTSVTMTSDLTLCFNKYGVAVDAPITPNTTGVTFTKLDVGNPSHIYMRASVDDAMPDITNENDWVVRPTAADGCLNGAYYFQNKNGLKIGETFYKPNVDKGNDGNVIEFVKQRDSGDAVLDYFINPGTVTQNGTLLELGGLFVWDGKLVEYAPTTFQWNGETWIQIVEKEYEFTLNGLNSLTNIRDDNGAWTVYMDYTGEFPEDKHISWPATIGGQETTASVMIDEGKILITVDPEQVASDGTADTTLVLKAGTVNHVTLTSDATLCFNKYGLAVNTPITPDTTNVEFSLYREANLNKQNDIYLKPNKEDSLTVELNEQGGFDLRPTVMSGYDADAGVYYFDNPGIQIDDSFYLPNEGELELVKHNWLGSDSREYYIGLNKITGVDTLIQTGTTLTLGGLYTYGGKLVEFAPTTLRWNGSAWTKTMTLTELSEGTTVCEAASSAEEGYQLVSFTSINSATSFNEERGWHLYLKPSETLPGDNDTGEAPARFTGLTMSVNGGEKFAVQVDNSSHEGTGYINIPAERLPGNVDETTYVILHAGSAVSGSGCDGITLKKDVIMKVDADENWSTVTHDGTKWKIHLKSDIGFAGQENESFLWPITIDGQQGEAVVNKEAGEFVMTLYSMQVPTDGTENVKLTLKSGSITGSQASVIALGADVTLFFNKYGLAKDSPIEPDTKDIGMALMPESTTKTHIYLHALKDDVWPVDNTWLIRPTTMTGVVDGKYYFEQNSGVFVDDVQYYPNDADNPNNPGSTNVEVIKHNAFDNAETPTDDYKEYFIGLSSLETSIADGTTVTLKGLFLWEGKLIEFTPVNFKWDEANSAWTIGVNTTHISGDANGDGIADVRDIVRMKTVFNNIMAECQIPVSTTDANLVVEVEGEAKLDIEDLKELKLKLIGAPEIELAAYCGPRRGGYRNYVDADGNVTSHPNDPKDGWEGWITEKDFQDYLDCGFTYLLPEWDGLYGYNKVDEKGSVSSFEESDLYPYMELAEHMNIPVVASSDELLHSITASEKTELTASEKAHLLQMHTHLSKYRMLKGYALRDEPSVTFASAFTATKNYLSDLDSDLFFYTACLPLQAGRDNLGLLTTQSTDDVEVAYKDYMDTYSKTLGYFSYDLYPLWLDWTGTKDNYVEYNCIDETWFTNLQMVAEHAKENQYDASITVQSSSYGTTHMHHRKITSKADIGFQVYTALAYGMKSINYYTYWTHWNDSASNYTQWYDGLSAMVNYPSEEGGEPVKTDAYYAVKAVNQEIKKFDHVFLNFDWEGTMAIQPLYSTASDAFKQAQNAYTSSRIASATATAETIIGCMKDANGRDGFMLVNATEPSNNTASNVTVKFNNATKAIAYIEGTETVITLQNGSYTFALDAGEGVFVIPVS